MARYESPEPVEIIDRLLWRDAQQMLDRHAQAGPDGRCGWCGWQWPCPPRRLAERAEVAASRVGAAGGPGDPRRESWTARHDLNGASTLPSRRADPAGGSPASQDLMSALEEAPTAAAPAQPRRNSGLFD
jgi:hypothetical protein